MRRLALCAAVLVGAATLVAAPVGAQSLDDVREERRQLQQRLDQAARDLGEVETLVAEVEAEHDELAGHADELAGELAELDELLAVRVREVFKHGTNLDPVAVFLASDDPSEALSRAETVHRLVRGDVADSEDVVASRTHLESIADRVEERGQDLDAALAEQRRVMGELEEDLARAQALEDRLEEEERERERERERRRAEREAQRQAEAEAEEQARQEEAEAQQSTASDDAASDDSASDDAASGGSGTGGGGSSSDPAPTGSGGMACPVDQPRSFTDTWGDPRSGGRSHRGTDILAPMGTPVRAITDGVWDIQSPGPSAGLWAILRGSDGNQYWYMHLQSHTVSDGARVSAGQQTGTNGDTGNARGTPHVHFELHPGGGGAINPYPTLRRVCG